MPKVSINLVTWNAERFIEDCLHSVLDQTYTDYSLIIIDNGSTDNTVEIIHERFPHLNVIRHKTNLGFSKAYNQTIHWSKSDYVLILNQDVVLDPDFLSHAVAFMDQMSMCASLTGKIYRLQENEKTKYIDSLGLAIKDDFSSFDIASGELDQNDEHEQIAEVFGVSGACALFRRKALEEVAYQNEYFDEDFFAYKEDVDLAFRLKKANWKAYYLPKAIAYHSRSARLEKVSDGFWSIIKNRRKKSKFANFYSYRNQLFLLLKNHPRPTVKNKIGRASCRERV